MASSDRSQPDFVGDDTDWPRASVSRLITAALAGAAAIASFLGIVEFLIPSLSDAGSSERRWQIIGVLALGALLYAIWPWISIANRRIQQYGPLRSSAVAQRTEIDRLSGLLESSITQKLQDDVLITELREESDRLRQGTGQLSDRAERIHLENRSLVDLIISLRNILNLLDQVEVVRAVAIEDEVLLLVEPSDDLRLGSGDEVVVIDGDTGAPLGIFLCSHQSSASAWFARESQIYDRLWWGFMRTTAETRAVPTIRIIGLVNRRKVHHDDERPA